MPTVTLKVSDEERALWQRAADRDCMGNLSEWLRQTAARATSVLPQVRTHAEPERLSTGRTRPFRGVDAKGSPLRR